MSLLPRRRGLGRAPAVLFSLLAAALVGRCGGGEESSHGHSHGTAHELGTSRLAGAELRVTWFGEVRTGAECSVNVVLTSGADTVRAVRAWVGDEAGNGTLRRKLDGETELHQHFPIPEGLPENSALWIELESTDGSRVSTSLAVPH